MHAPLPLWGHNEPVVRQVAAQLGNDELDALLVGGYAEQYSTDTLLVLADAVQPRSEAAHALGWLLFHRAQTRYQLDVATTLVDIPDEILRSRREECVRDDILHRVLECIRLRQVTFDDILYEINDTHDPAAVVGAALDALDGILCTYLQHDNYLDCPVIRFYEMTYLTDEQRTVFDFHVNYHRAALTERQVRVWEYVTASSEAASTPAVVDHKRSWPIAVLMASSFLLLNFFAINLIPVIYSPALLIAAACVDGAVLRNKRLRIHRATDTSMLRPRYGARCNLQLFTCHYPKKGGKHIVEYGLDIDEAEQWIAEWTYDRESKQFTWKRDYDYYSYASRKHRSRRIVT